MFSRSRSRSKSSGAVYHLAHDGHIICSFLFFCFRSCTLQPTTELLLTSFELQSHQQQLFVPCCSTGPFPRYAACKMRVCGIEGS